MIWFWEWESFNIGHLAILYGMTDKYNTYSYALDTRDTIGIKGGNQFSVRSHHARQECRTYRRQMGRGRPGTLAGPPATPVCIYYAIHTVKDG